MRATFALVAALLLLLAVQAGRHKPKLHISADMEGVAGVAFDGVPVTECAWNAAVAGHLGAPVVMISGDDAAVTEVRRRVGDIEAAESDRGQTRAAHPVGHRHHDAQAEEAPQAPVRPPGACGDVGEIAGRSDQPVSGRQIDRSSDRSSRQSLRSIPLN